MWYVYLSNDGTFKYDNNYIAYAFRDSWRDICKTHYSITAQDYCETLNKVIKRKQRTEENIADLKVIFS
jgi:hypothetical protein